MLRRLYDWVVALADRPSAPWALGLVAFSESSVFIVPPDVLLAPMALARPDLAWRYAFICTVGSVTGGIVGYLIGHLLFDTVGMWILTLLNMADRINDVKCSYDKWGALFILAKGLTPIPYKLVAIVSGALQYNIILFIILSLVTRGLRFYILAGLIRRYGDPIRSYMEKHLGLFFLGIIVTVILGFMIVSFFTHSSC